MSFNADKVDVWEVCSRLSGVRLSLVTSRRKAQQKERDGYTVRYLGVWTFGDAARAVRVAS